jgi:hypothetical protein
VFILCLFAVIGKGGGATQRCLVSSVRLIPIQICLFFFLLSTVVSFRVGVTLTKAKRGGVRKEEWKNVSEPLVLLALEVVAKQTKKDLA